MEGDAQPADGCPGRIGGDVRDDPETPTADSFRTFGELLRFLRHRAGLRQRELAARVGYSEAHISRLEGGHRRADPVALAALFIPALKLERQPDLAARLLTLADRSHAPHRAGSRVASYGIPLPPPHLVARPDALAALRSLMEGQRVVVVCGLAGAGKSTLMAAVAREWAEAQGPVCWATMSRSPGSAPQTLLRHLAAVVSEAAGTGRSDEAEALPLDRQLELLVPALVGTPVLFCVDDAQLLSPTDGLAALSYLSAHGGVRVLLASRERLPMADAGMLRLPGLDKDQAVELATRLDPRMPRHLAERLAARTGGNPMLLRLALGQSLQPGCDRERLVDRLESDPEVGEDLLDAALDGLSGTATDLVCLLAVFRQPVDLHDETLARHLLAWRPGLDLHQAVVELRARHLLDHPSSAALHPFIRDRLYLRMAHDLPQRRRLHAIAASYTERGDDPLEAAWHLGQCGDPGQAADLLIAHVRTLVGRGQNLPAADLAEQLLHQAQHGQPDDAEAPARVDRELLRRLHVLRGDLMVNTERGAEADEAYRRALGEPMPAPVRAFVVLRLAESLLERHQPAEALALCVGTLTGLGPPDVLLRARLDAVQAWARIELSEYREALHLARRSLESAAPLAAVAPQLAGEVVARAEWTLGVALRLRLPGKRTRWLDNRDDAAAHLHRSADAARATGMHHLAARALLNLGALRWEAGDMTGALVEFQRAEATARTSADSVGVARALSSIAMAHMGLGNLADALTLYQEALSLRGRLADTHGALNTKVSMAVALMHIGHTDEALTIVEEVAKAQQAEPRVRVYALDTRGIVLLTLGRPEPALRTVEQALTLARRNTPAIAPLVELHVALCQLMLGDPEPARHLARGDINAHTFEDELDLMFLRAALAHADHDAAGIASVAIDLTAWIEQRGIELHTRTPARLLAAFERQAPLRDLPRLMWCAQDRTGASDRGRREELGLRRPGG
jgi:tetratricopeptide (TPR) repeat protein/transcriptional regulator with XRE-family HTH domain